MIKIKKLRKINEIFNDYHSNSYDVDDFDGKYYWINGTESGAKIRLSILPQDGLEEFVSFEYLVVYPNEDETTFKPRTNEKLDKEKLKILNSVLSFFDSKIREHNYCGFNFSGEKAGPLAKFYTTLVKKLDVSNYNLIEKETYKNKNFTFIRKDFEGFLENGNYYSNNLEYIAIYSIKTYEDSIVLSVKSLSLFGNTHSKIPLQNFKEIFNNIFLPKIKQSNKEKFIFMKTVWSDFPSELNSIMEENGYKLSFETESGLSVLREYVKIV